MPTDKLFRKRKPFLKDFTFGSGLNDQSCCLLIARDVFFKWYDFCGIVALT